MMFEIADINVFAVIAATVAGFVLGGLWYGPLFGQAWLDAVGKGKDDIQPSPGPFIISLGASLVTATVLSFLRLGLGVESVAGGALLGALCSLGFTATAMASDNAFCGWGWRLYAIQAGYRFTYTVVMGIILTAWP
jgi:hypothetical protein